MGKLKRKSSEYSPISRKVLSGLRKTINRKVIDISELKFDTGHKYLINIILYCNMVAQITLIPVFIVRNFCNLLFSMGKNKKGV